MPEYDNTNRGVLFKNDRKESDKHADYRGSINVAGVDYWLDAWIREGQKGKFMSLSVKPKNAPAKPAQSEYAKQAQSSTKASLNAQAPADLSDDVPF